MEKPYIINGGIAVDDRGSVTFANDFDFSGVKRFYQIQNHRKGFIRAWHGHLNESKYVYVPSGSALVGAVRLQVETNKNETTNNTASLTPEKFILSSKAPKILYIPKGFANGFMCLEENTILQFFSTSTLSESLNDDIRYNYNTWNIWEEDFR